MRVLRAGPKASNCRSYNLFTADGISQTSGVILLCCSLSQRQDCLGWITVMHSFCCTAQLIFSWGPLMSFSRWWSARSLIWDKNLRQASFQKVNSTCKWFLEACFASISLKQLINFRATLVSVIFLLCPLAHAPGVSSRFGKRTVHRVLGVLLCLQLLWRHPSSFSSYLEPTLLPSKTRGWSSCRAEWDLLLLLRGPESLLWVGVTHLVIPVHSSWGSVPLCCV